MPVIDITTDIRAPIQRVFDLSRSVDLHTASTSQTGERAIAGVTSGLMYLGESVTWRARHFRIWQHLTTRITAFDPPRYFRDSMIDGAFQRVDHDHFFLARGEFVKMRDVFDFDSPLGILGGIADRLFLAAYIRRFLETRNALIKTVAEQISGVITSNRRNHAMNPTNEDVRSAMFDLTATPWRGLSLSR